MQTREIPCQYYVHENSCLKGRAGTFYDSCQHCPKYCPKKGARPARADTKKKKQMALRDKETRQMLNGDY